MTINLKAVSSDQQGVITLEQQDWDLDNASSKNNNEPVPLSHQPSSSSHNHRHQSSQQQKDPPSRSNEDNFSSDTFVKRYKVIEKIGEGSYSEVLKCQNKLDGTVVACKRLKHVYKSLEDVANIAEIATLRTIPKHNNILQMLEIHYDKTLGKVSLVFELMDINLYELIKDRKRLLPESRVRAIMFQLFRALRHLHKLGVFHRDIKPENILIKSKTDQLKLGDLGSVRGMFSRPPYTEYISTRWYRSPECLLTAGHYSHKMDVWAAGCVFYEVLTLRPLFPGSSEIDQINRINNVLGPPPIKLLETFQKQAEMERETYRGQSQLNRRQQIQKVLNGFSSRYMMPTESSNKNLSSNNSIKSYRRNNMEFHFAGKEGTGLDKILPAHISREAKEIIKSCLLYDPEQRPTAQRIVQLSYFSELRESYNKNPERVSSKSVVLICGDTVTDHCTPVELGTLGDHKIRYRRGISQKNSRQKRSTSKLRIEKKSSSVKSTDINNNPKHRKRSSSSSEKMVAMVAKASQSRLSGIGGAGSSVSKLKVLEQRSKLLQNRVNRSGERKRADLVTTKSSSNRASHMSNSTVQTGVGQVTSMKMPVNSKNSQIVGGGGHRQRLQEPLPLKKKQQLSSSTTSFESVQSPEKNYEKKREPSISREPKSTIHTLPDISLSPYVKPPSELKFLRNKIKSDHQHPRSKVVPPQLAQGIQPPAQNNNSEQQMSTSTRVAVVPLKVAAAAIKYAKVNSRKIRGDPIAVLDNTVTTDQTESSGTNMFTVGGKRGGRYSATDDTGSYATASSVKIGKLRFRQTSLQTNSQQQQNCKILKDCSTITPSSFQRSKIPILVEDPPQPSRRPTKLLSSPTEQRRETGTTEKWRNKGISRMIPMSPERERNIQLLRESLMLDKNKRLKLRYQEEEHEQNLLNNNVSSSIAPIDSRGVQNHNRKGATYKSNYDYASQDALQSTGEQQQGNYSSAGGVGNGKYRHSTTDYENHDVQETSSSAAALENQQRNIFNAATRKGRVVIPPLESIMKKPMLQKKSSELYPPEMIDLYSTRYRGPDSNMNILKDSGNTYVKQSNPESRAQEVKEKLNHKFDQRRQEQLSVASSGHQVGDQPSKIVSERSSYAHYSSSLLGAGEEEHFTRVGISRMERRPPLPPVGGQGCGRTNLRGYRDPSPDTGQQYGQLQGRRASMIPTTGYTKEIGGRTNARSLSNATGNSVRNDLKESARKKSERSRKTMRDDVFCSSDDDVVITMRKKFDNLISERARKLSESLKGSATPYAGESHHPRPSKILDSNSEDNLVKIRRRSRNTGAAAADKSKKYARRELRARMAESLTMNFSLDKKWRAPEQEQPRLEKKVSNESGDWVLPKCTEKSSGRVVGNHQNLTSYDPSSVLKARKNVLEAECKESPRYHDPQSSRIHPFPIQDRQVYRRGQMFTPPTNKPVYQSPQLGTMLHDRKLRYSHNNPMPVSGNYGKGLKDGVDTLKKRQRI